MLARDPEVLGTMLSFYAPTGSVLDVTASKRRMWRGIERPVVYLDIDRSQGPDVAGDFRFLPFASQAFDVIVFDPPHLPMAAASRLSHEGMIATYGLQASEVGDNISGFFAPFLREAARVLRQDGVIFAKLKDFVHNHRYQWTLVDWISAVRSVVGLTPCDLIVKRDPSGGALTSSKWVTAHHVRNAHCWWAVVRKGRCERARHV